MILRELADSLPRVTTSGPLDVEVARLTADSRNAGPGDLFAAIRGTSLDGHSFIEDVIHEGCRVVLAETAPPKDLDADIAWLHVGDSREALARMASTFHDNPAASMTMAGVTGTNGKTTTSYLIHHIMKTVWHRAGLLGTILVDDGESVSPAKHTTPGSIELSGMLRRMADNGCRGVAMEVSSHGIHQKRVAAIGFDAMVFTNLTQDHLDYHGTLEAYYEAKADWFMTRSLDRLGKKPTAVINVDDAHGADLAEALDGKMPVLRFGFGLHTDFRANNFRQNTRGMEFELSAKGKSFLVRAPLIGRFNAYNLLAALAAASACKISPREAIATLAEAPQVPGRMENVGNAGGATVFVDYAHTPDALENACRTLKELNPRRLITVFGCGGDRDKAKRPLMAAAVARNSDACVITSDNPRSENPEDIIRQVESGMGGMGFRSFVDRNEAIQYAINNALSGDIILIAGKGHETTQQFAGQTIKFDDRIHARDALRVRAKTIADSR
jgi:UDP-N-acetylmuramoyl-L-alanyl-D-glutamate--2,6-diaminopimelate ligase